MKMRRSRQWIYRPTSKIGFTLIEVLVVIAIAVVIAGLLMTVVGAMVQKSNVDRAVSERDQLETAIDHYHAKYGYYPPGNALGNANFNQLYYELLGTETNASGFETLDGGSQISSSTIQQAFGVTAFMNCQKGSGDDAAPAQTFLSGLKASEIASNGQCNIIVTAANSDAGYAPLPGVYSLAGRPANPWCYMCPGTNNPNGYDLWIEVFVGNKKNLICNWAKNVQYQ